MKPTILILLMAMSLGACDEISRKLNRRGLCMSDEECGSLMFIGWGH